MLDNLASDGAKSKNAGMADTVPFCPDCGPSADPATTICPNCGRSTYSVLRRREFQSAATGESPLDAASSTKDQGAKDRSDSQRAEKFPALIFFLAITLSILGFGLFAPDSQFSDDDPRGKWIFFGVIVTITSTLWFFYGRIDYSLPQWMVWMINMIRAAIGRRTSIENDPPDLRNDTAEIPTQREIAASLTPTAGRNVSLQRTTVTREH